MNDTVLSRATSAGLAVGSHVLVARAREGADAHWIARLARRHERAVLHVARDAERAEALAAWLAFFDPGLRVLLFPGWDCMPYDRVSPQRDIMARRLSTLAALACGIEPPFVVVATANALVQRVPPAEAVVDAHLRLAPGARIGRDALVAHLERSGFRRVSTVVEPGEYAVRGGLVDIWPSDRDEPVRVDFFGETVESLRAFEPASQCSLGRLTAVELGPVSEAMLSPEAVARFRDGYLQEFGAVTADPLYEALSAGRPQPGMEHWLPLFYERVATLFDYLPEGSCIGFDHQVAEAIAARQQQIGEHYEARVDPSAAGAAMGSVPYRPLPPHRLYLDEQELARLLTGRERYTLSPFAIPPGPPAGFSAIADAGAEPARDFARERADPAINLFDAVVAHLEQRRREGRPILIASSSEGARERLRQVLADHGLDAGYGLAQASEAKAGAVGFVVLPLEHGFVLEALECLAEQDILGDRLARPVRRRRRRDALPDLSALSEGDYVVHAEHGIGRFEGLVTLEIAGAPHDCLKIVYQGGDRLFVPVENLDLLTRYGGADGDVALDRLGGAAWQQRKARVKKRIREMAEELIRLAAVRATRSLPPMLVPHGLYDEFAARFPYEETDDQLAAIEAVIEDLASGRPMDRLICGDVGFGKTEVALRAAFVVAMCGRQVAVLCPTTLLARQHFHVFRERFAGLPIEIRQLSRFVSAKEARDTKERLAAGKVDIVIGTHALLGEDVRFRDLGLVVIDEEQHFGVAQKEKLKKLRAEVHVLTMTATPIPRTLHMALGGLKDLSIIATPPVDRLSVRTFVMPVDPVVIREAILREHYRGGQTFYVCPHVSDQPRLLKQLRDLVPEVRIATAHGRMPARELEEVMGAFYDRRVDVLLSTNIVESGLDIPNANTLIVHRADRFGLAQLYQLRGRVGRSKVRAYAYFTYPADVPLSQQATRRLEVLQTLEGLGAGFQLANYDLDIRGAGNLLGEEQSGQIREVGFELYNQMLEQAVAELRTHGAAETAPEEGWTPQITIDAAALLPETYIADLDVRLATYRRLAHLEEPGEIDAFAAELVDRFGPLPEETRQLLEIVHLKLLCRRANVAKLDAGPRGLVIAFRDNRFARPERLIEWIGKSGGRLRVRPDHRLVVAEETRTPVQRLALARRILDGLARMAAA